MLAAVTAGIYLGWRPPRLTSPSTRLQAYSLWEVLTFMLNSLLFVLMGLQLPAILEGISEDYSPATLALYAAAVCLAVIAARFVWIFPATYIPRKLSRRLRERDPSPPWQNVAVIAYAGIRGRSPWPQRSRCLWNSRAGTSYSSWSSASSSLPSWCRV